jgi:hypothetical protein
MDLMLLRLFQREVERHCQYVLGSWREMRVSLAAGELPRFWWFTHGLLTASANISKALWGQRGKYTDERRELRESLAVSDESPLRPTTFRNHFEHFDERLDEWWHTSTNHNYMDDSVMPLGSVAGLHERDMFRIFDNQTGELRFWGDAYSIPAIIAEVQRLLPIAAMEAAKPHWQPPLSPPPGK